MSHGFLLKGLIIGFSIAAPVGPIGILCIQLTLARGRLSGFIAGIGAATADAVYGSIAGFGLTFISNFLLKQQFFLNMGGAIFLFYLGIKIFLKKPTECKVEIEADSYSKTYFSTFLFEL